MGNSSSSNNLPENITQKELLDKVNSILGGSDTETFVQNNNAQHYMSKISNLLQDTEMGVNRYNAVSGDTENLSNLSGQHMNDVFTVSENLVPLFKESNAMNGGSQSIMDRLSNLFQDTEMNGGMEQSNSILNRISNLLQDTETNMTGGSELIMNRLSSLLHDNEVFEMSQMNGGSHASSDLLNKISNLLQETEQHGAYVPQENISVIHNKLSSLLEDSEVNAPVNLRGGALESENLFTSEESGNQLHKKKHTSKKSKKSEEDNNNVVPVKEIVVEEDSTEEVPMEEKEVVPMKEKEVVEDNEESEQSGGVELDTELKNILMTLKKDNQEGKQKSISGGKGRKSRKSSRKSSRRSVTDEADDETSAMNSDVDTDDEDYLSSTSSLNTSDINIKHYR
jgi:hypothetical protein